MSNNSLASCLLGLGLALINGCASKESSRNTFQPGSGIAEFRQITDLSVQAIQDALSSLERVAAQSNRCSPEALTALGNEVRELQVESLQVRARAQAILARGDAYFERWHETMKMVKDPDKRALAEARRPQLQETFGKIKKAAEESRNTFKPFVSGLRTLRNLLENDPAALCSGTNQELLADTRTHGQELVQHLSSIRKELDSIEAMLTRPAATSGKEQPA